MPPLVMLGRVVAHQSPARLTDQRPKTRRMDEARALPSVEEAIDQAQYDIWLKKEIDKYPWGPHVPIGRRGRSEDA